MTISEATDGPALAAARTLLRAYAESVDLAEIPDLEGELRALPGPYAAPQGRILLAWDQGEAVGCIALRPLEDGSELKRLHVRPALRGKGIGKALIAALIEVARAQGYPWLRLDPLEARRPALALYRLLGFREVPASGFNEVPDYAFDPANDVHHLELDLRALSRRVSLGITARAYLLELLPRERLRIPEIILHVDEDPA